MGLRDSRPNVKREVLRQVINHIRALARYMEYRHAVWGYADDMEGAGLEAIVRKPQPTKERMLACARWAMLNELRRNFGRGKYRPVLVPYESFHNSPDHTSVEEQALSSIAVSEWLSQLSPVQRSRALRRAEGFTSREIAAQDDVDESRISQVLSSLSASWQEYSD